LALNNFGVRELLDCFVHIPSPRPKIQNRLVDPKEEKMTGFVLNPCKYGSKHRDRLVYKIVSGTLKGTNRITHVRQKKN
jgi:peptide chain release factor 3